MSADNAIILLETPCNNGSEYRVAHVQAAENIHYEHEDGNPEYVVLLFGNAPVFQKHEDAVKFAKKMEQEIMDSDFAILEYGVYDIALPHSFEYFIERTQNKRIRRHE